MQTEERRYAIALAMISGIGGKTAKKLVSHCGTAQAAFEMPSGKLQRIDGVSKRLAELIKTEKETALRKADEEIKKAAKHGIQILHYTDKAYPEKLKHCFDAPAILFFKGDTDLNRRKNISIVGTRKATVYGKKFTRDFVAALAHHKPLIVSGLAYGIDIEAHRAALHHELPTVGVMASGMDIVYPPSHRDTAQQMILENGGLLTEQFIGTRPDSRFFPARNRIIAGMTDLTLVVEAAAKGGALITARLANSYDRHVAALPGNVDSPFSKGCNHLIRTHQAHLVESPQDIEKLLNWDVQTATVSETLVSEAELLEKLSPKQQKIYLVLKETGTLEVDELAFRSGIPVNVLVAELLNLEFQGLVSPLPGKKYQWK